ncbi:MAG: hypothetical protein HY763_08170 [Planctomycetes bacterium]|nr:hypothetical protein [Planctomycetota bacterium]
MSSRRLLYAVSCIVVALSGGRAAAQVCPFEDLAHCQMHSGFGRVSDRLSGVRHLDDLRPAGASISRVCWVTCWDGTAPNQRDHFECSGSSGGTQPPDDFDLYIYADDAGLPGLPVAGVPLGGYQLVVDDKAPVAPGWTRCWRYTAPLVPPPAVIPGDCYWLEITGLGEDQAEGRCTVHWGVSWDGNGIGISDDNAIIEYEDLIAVGDLAWCLDSGIVAATDPPQSQDGGCGDVPVACCKVSSSSIVCDDTGTWTDCMSTPLMLRRGVAFPYLTCPDLQQMGGCPTPANDECANATPVCMGQTPDPSLGECDDGVSYIDEVCSTALEDCTYPWWSCLPRPGVETFRCRVPADNCLALTDGPNTAGTSCEGSGLNSFQADVWYEYVAPCTGRMAVGTCTDPSFDGMLQVFGSNAPGQSCACPLDNSQSLKCNDDGYCIAAANTGTLSLDVVRDGCYLIRVGGWAGVNGSTPETASCGQTELSIGLLCDPLPTPPALQGTAKNRYLSFAPNNPSARVQFQVARVDPPFGIVGWVGVPNADGLAALQPSPPSPRLWPEAVGHVSGCEIIPAAGYEIRASNNGGLTVSAPLMVGTVPRPHPKFWGDTVGDFQSLCSVGGTACGPVGSTCNGTGVCGLWTAPNGVVSVNDFLAALQKFQSLATAPHVTVVDVVGAGQPGQQACLNRTGNISDVFNLIKAFQGDPYPFTTDPAECPVCP